MTLILFEKQIFYKFPRKFLKPLEVALLLRYYFSIQDYLSYPNKAKIISKKVLFQLLPKSSSKAEVTFFIYSKACERLLIPLLLSLLQRTEVREKQIKVNLLILSGVHQLQLNRANLRHLQLYRCPIETDYFSLIKACVQPKNKLVVACLDHRLLEFHRCGVDTVDKLKEFSVKTISIQHGGTREDSVKSLASSASETIMVWGKRVWRELVNKYAVDSNRLRLVGNPLHDRLTLLDRQGILKSLSETYPHAQKHFANKKIVLLATCLHSEYRGYENEQSLYQKYIQHIYQSLDFSQVFLLVKMHPLDQKEPNLYRQAAQKLSDNSLIIVEPDSKLDVYSLLLISDLLITRCSTVAEEALLMSKKVVAFDLFPSGPSQGYKHLEEYGDYTTVYASPQEALSKAVFAALSSSTSQQAKEVEEDITYSLDGNSTTRAVDEILTQVSTP